MTRRQVALIAGAAVITFLAGTAITRWNSQERDRSADATGPSGLVDNAAHGLSASDADAAGERREDGARRSALTHATASQRWLYLSDDELDAAVRLVATPAAEDRLAAQVRAEVSAARQALAASPGRVWWVVRPLAWRVESFTPDAARVSVWTVTVLSAADVAVPQADWVTVTVDVAWLDDDWRLEAVSDRPGPTPMLGTTDQPWQPEPFDEALDGFARLDGEDLVRAER